MKVITTETIGGRAVVQVQKFLGFTVYEWAEEDGREQVDLLFVDSEGVLRGTVTVCADYGQGTGYISDIAFKDK